MTAWTRSLRRRTRPRGWVAALLVGCTLGALWLVTYVAGGAGKVAPHWFYISILLGAFWFGTHGAAIAAVVAGLLAGLLMPADVVRGVAQEASDWELALRSSSSSRR